MITVQKLIISINIYLFQTRMWNPNGILVFLGLALACSTLHTQTSGGSSFYNPQTYERALNDTQMRFENQINQLNSQLAQVDAIIKDTSTSTGVKITSLTQKLADERNSLYEIEQYLKIPYQLKICQCRELTEAQKTQMQNKLNEINNQISSLESQVSQCTGDNCTKYTQMKQQLKQMKIYSQSVAQILSSDCCKQKYQFKQQTAQGLVDLNATLYKDNLNAPNWYYGTTSQQNYRLQMFQLTTKYNISTCPLSHPFANINMNRCQRCHPREAIFNLGTRSCFYCGGLSYLNLTTSLCQACPTQQYYNGTLKKCVNCPNEMFLNTTSQKCQNCPPGYHFDAVNSQCVSCPAGYEYDRTSKTCKQCNASAGYFYNAQTYKCQGCPDRMMFNSATQKCQACAGNTYFNKAQGACVSCPSNTVLNPNTLACQPCPSGSYYDTTQGKCVSCPANQHFDSVLQKCIPNSDTSTPITPITPVTPTTCPEGLFYDSDLKKCVNNNNIGFCPHEKPYYDIKIHQCVPCPAGTAINTVNYKCEPV